MHRAKLFPAVLLLSALLLALPLPGSPPVRADAPRLPLGGPEKPVPAVDFTAYTPSGKRVRLSDYRGRVVLLNFWATWCPPCKYEMPGFERLHRAMAGKPFALLAVDVGEDVAKVQAFLRRYNFSFPVLLDPQYRIGDRYGAESLPLTFIIDRDGQVVHWAVGARDWDQPAAFALIESLMAKPQKQSPFLSYGTGSSAPAGGAAGSAK